MEKENHKNQIILGLSRSLVINDASIIRKVISENLKDIATVFEADRALIFLTDPGFSRFSVTFEWHHEGFSSVKNSLQQLNLRDYMIWGKFSTPEACFQIGNTNNIPDSYPFDSKLFRDTGCQSFIQKALSFDSKKTGFVALLSNRAEQFWNSSMEDFLEITSELLKNLIIRLHNIETTVSDKKTPVSQNFLRLSGKSDKQIAEVFDKLYGELHHGVLVFDVALKDFIFSNKKAAEFLGFPNNPTSVKNTVFSVFKSNDYVPGDFFSAGNVLKIKDFAFNHQKRYLQGTVSPVKKSSWVVMSISDITPIALYEKTEKSFNNQLRILNEAAIELILSPSSEKEMFKFIGETGYSLVENCVVVVNKYNQEEGCLQTIFAKGFGNTIDLIARLIGKHPFNKKYPLEYGGKTYEEIITLRTKEATRGLHELTFGSIAEPIARKIEKVLNVNRFFSCGLYTGKKLYGTISFLLKPGADINAWILDAYGRMISNAFYGLDMKSKLTKTSKMLSDAASLAKIGYWEYDFNSHSFRLGRKLFEKLEPVAFEDTRQEIIMPLDDFLSKYTHHEEAIRIRSVLQVASQHQRDMSYEQELEFRLITADDKTMFIFTRGAMQKDGKLIGVAQDISEIKKVQRNLTESELKFHNLIEQSLDAIVIVKDDGTITGWNPSAENITGLSSENVTGKYAWEIESTMIFTPSLHKQHPQQSPDKLKKRFFQFFNASYEREPFVSEISIRNQSGKLIHLFVTSFVFTANQSKFLCRICKDVTLEKQKQEQQKQKEILQKTAKAKELFLDNMSHEMRTPLSGIIGMTDILMHTRLSDQQEEMLKVVKESSDSLLDLISNIHELSRLETEGMTIRKNPFHLEVMMEKTINIFKASALQKSIQLAIENQIDYQGMFIGDEFRLRQVVSNMLANAIKFTPPGGRVDLIAGGNLIDTNTMEIKLEIRDTGIGVEKEKIPILFEKFTQADESYTREYEGAGIGLSISRELIRLMGGDIGVESEPRKGSTFWIKLTLPLAKKSD